MIDVLLADDDELVRAGIGLMIGQTADISVVAEAGTGREAVRLARCLRPDVVLMDVRMPDLNGIDATREIAAHLDEVKVLMLTTFELDEYVFDALQAGASGFLLKRSPPEVLVDGIRTIAAGEGLLSPSVTRRLIEEFATAPTNRSDPRLERLTDREAEVLREMALGKSNLELAGALFISENTVKTHVKRVLTKLGARDRAQAVVIAYQGGLMDR
jgi:DNA-binding NarL/FixJ family response regulator